MSAETSPTATARSGDSSLSEPIPQTHRHGCVDDEGRMVGERSRGIPEDEFTPADQPSLRDQLSALQSEQMEERLRSDFGVAPRAVQPEELVPGFRMHRKEELLEELLKAYAAAHAAAVLSQSVIGLRRYIPEESPGVALPESLTAPLLCALRKMCWKDNARPGVQSSGYAVLKKPPAPAAGPPTAASFPEKNLPEHDARVVRKKILELASNILQSRAANPAPAAAASSGTGKVLGKAAAFDFTALAISRNFSHSPHVDRNDVCPQFALSLGDYDESGGKGALCVEESAFTARVLRTKNTLVCIDGRFPHWVAAYEGERFSVIWYRSCPPIEAAVQAWHPVVG